MHRSVNGNPAPSVIPSAKETGDLRLLFFPPKCHAMLASKDASEVIRKAIAPWDVHVREVASIATTLKTISRRDREFMQIPHRDGCKKERVFIPDSFIRLWKQDRDILWDAGLRDYVTDFPTYVLTAMQFAAEMRL